MRTRAACAAGLLAFAVCANAAADSAEPSLIPSFSDSTESPPPSPPSPPAAAAAPFNNPFAPRDDAEGLSGGGQGRPYATVGSRLWLTSGSLNTRYRVLFPPQDTSDPAIPVWLGETQNYGGSGLMPVESAEIAPLRWLSFAVEYGSDRTAGSEQDHDWIDSPESTTLTNLVTGAVLYNPNYQDDLVYGADANSFRDWFAASMYLRVLDGVFQEDLGMTDTFDLALGAERYRQNSTLTNLSLNVNNNYLYSPGTPTGPIAGDASYYQGYWQGPHIGAREEFKAGGRFAFQGLVLWSPLMEYSGSGFDNLAAGSGGYRTTAPNYQDFAHGTAIHFAFSASWTPVRWLQLQAGYQRLYFYTRTGTRRYYNDDGTSTDYQLDYATADLGGVFAGASLRY